MALRCRCIRAETTLADREPQGLTSTSEHSPSSRALHPEIGSASGRSLAHKLRRRRLRITSIFLRQFHMPRQPAQLISHVSRLCAAAHVASSPYEWPSKQDLGLESCASGAFQIVLRSHAAEARLFAETTPVASLRDCTWNHAKPCVQCLLSTN